MSIAFYSLTLAFLLLRPANTAAHAMQALCIWGKNVVPILFPYMVFSRLLSQRLHARHMPVVPMITLLGLIGGSPSGAAIVASSASQLTARSLFALSALCGTISPMFILGTLETWILDAKLCRMLLGVHWLSAITCAGITWLFENNQNTPHSAFSPDAELSFAQAIAQSIDAILQVGGCIICCSVLSGLFEELFHNQHPFTILLHAVLEISGGTHALWQSTFSHTAKCILLSSALGFGSVSILMQNHAVLSQLGLPMQKLFLFALLRMLCSGTCMALLLTLL